ncbi:ImpL2 [Cordylochernes scorpioides]|uniref:ImpL2 n=1 Tax=Cordylochernes scorpioides TaxID=51811 RepID=A0ABY6L2K8_9ARAC|nr:ImpL2 [Cordylochernes scorpioides]
MTLLAKYHRTARSGTGLTRPGHSLFLRHPLPELVAASEAESIVLDCEAGGNPPPTIHWLKDGHRVAQVGPSPRYSRSVPTPALQQGSWEVQEAENDGNQDLEPQIGLSYTKSRLYLDCVEPRDSAVYTCVAENPYFRESTQTVLQVEESLRDSGARCLSKKSFGVPARVHMWTRSRLENTGGEAQLFCRAGGQPRPQVTWTGPENKSLENLSRFQVLANGDLMIRDIKWEDMGEYTCKVQNSRGSDSTETFLYPTLVDQKYAPAGEDAV